MIVNVQLPSRARSGFSSRTYSYYCDIDDIETGDMVLAPTSQGLVQARVCAVDVPEWRIAEDILPELKTIKERAEQTPPEPSPEQIGLDDLPQPPEELSISADVIRVTQLPVIEEQLRAVKAQVEKATSEAAAMVCTEETIQAVKAKRAELNKTFTALDSRRKEVKAAVMAPYDSFEAVFRQCITEPFKAADKALRDKVEQVEAVQKDTCEQNLRVYFAELCQLHGVDYITFEQAGIKIDMASAKAKTPRKLMDRLGEFVAGVANGEDQIRRMDDRDEIMAEYKRSLDVGQAVSAVQERRRRIEEEKRAAADRETARKRQEEAVAKVEATAPPVYAEPPHEDVFPRFTFTVLNATRAQLIRVRDFMRQEGIQYE